MKKTIWPLFIILIMPTFCLSQNFTIYTSIQGNQKCSFSGSEQGCADEGRVIDISVEKTGNISISENSFKLTGPPCPAYDGKGQRIPPTPLPDICSLFSGTITAAAVPPAGTTEKGYLTAYDKGYWTSCSTGEQHPFDTTITFTFDVVSLKLETNMSEIYLDAEEEVTITAAVFPPDAVVNWDVPECYDIIGRTATSVTIKNPAECAINLSREDMLNASIKMGCAEYSQQIEVFDIRGLQDVTLKMCGKRRYNPSKDKCVTCQGVKHVRPKFENTWCCDDEPYDKTNYYCLNCGTKNLGFIFHKSQKRLCCNGLSYNPVTDTCFTCGNVGHLLRKGQEKGLACCGTELYSPSVAYCMTSKKGKSGVFFYIWSLPKFCDRYGGYDASVDTCIQCGDQTTAVSKGSNMTCCGGRVVSKNYFDCKKCNGEWTVLDKGQNCPLEDKKNKKK